MNLGVVTVTISNIFNLDVSALGIDEFKVTLDDYFVFVVQETFLDGADVVGQFVFIFEAIRVHFVVLLEDLDMVMVAAFMMLVFLMMIVMIVVFLEFGQSHGQDAGENNL